MSNYTKSTNFTSKDSLASGNPLKIVKGSEIDIEFNNIATAVATKADTISPTFTGTPLAPTATSGTSTTQLATTAFVQNSFTAFTGTINMWPTATAPSGFLLCTGQNVSRGTYAALFALLGTTFGAGDGSTTFTLPDYRNRMPIGAGDLYIPNGQGGSKDAIVVAHTHTGTTGGQSNTHTHDYQKLVGASGTQYPGGAFGVDATQTTTVNSTDHTHNFTTASTGASGTNANLPPYIGIYFIIKT